MWKSPRRFVLARGGAYVYDFEVINRAGTATR